jgi:hypothetical protein
MTYSDKLNAVGLVLNLAGALLMYLYGVPRYRTKGEADTHGLLLESSGSRTTEADAIARAEFIANVGGALLVLGFVVQLVALTR